MAGILVTPRARRWLQNGRSARILHIFDEVCNLVNDQNDVISLVSPRVGAGPFTVVLEGDFTAGLDCRQPVSIDGARQRLTVGSLLVDIRRAAVWQPRPDWSQLKNLVWSDWAVPAALAPGIDSFLQQLLRGIAAGDVAGCQAGTYGLAGRGVGLTPTGDDVLMGVLYGLWVWYPRREWMDVIVKTAVPRTTTLSAAFLRAAAAGEATRHWHDLVNAGPDGRSKAIRNIHAIGHTSGADTWAGFLRTALWANNFAATGSHRLQAKSAFEEMPLKSRLPFTILQPAVYMQNIAANWQSIMQTGMYVVPYPVESRISLVDLADVAEAAAIVLTEAGHVGATYELAGTRPLSQVEVAQRLGEVNGRAVIAQEMSLDKWQKNAQAAGLSSYAIDTLIKMFRYYAAFGLAGNPNVLRCLLQREPATLSACARRWKQETSPAAPTTMNENGVPS